MNNTKVFQLLIDKIFPLSERFLSELTFAQTPVNFGIKREGYFVINTDKQLLNPENSIEIQVYNILLQACNKRQFNLLMIKF